MRRLRPSRRRPGPDSGSERGIAGVELGILVAVLALLAVVVTPLAGALAAHHTVARATSEGLRVATKVESNPRDGSGGCPDRRRADADTVIAAVLDAADLSDLDAGDVTLEPAALCDVLPGEEVAVRTSHQHDLGVLAETANDLAGIFSSEPILPTTLTVTARQHGVRE